MGINSYLPCYGILCNHTKGFISAGKYMTWKDTHVVQWKGRSQYFKEWVNMFKEQKLLAWGCSCPLNLYIQTATWFWLLFITNWNSAWKSKKSQGSSSHRQLGSAHCTNTPYRQMPGWSQEGNPWMLLLFQTFQIPLFYSGCQAGILSVPWPTEVWFALINSPKFNSPTLFCLVKCTCLHISNASFNVAHFLPFAYP